MLARPKQFFQKRPGTTLVLLVLGLTLLAYSNRFVQDDAFISFRYADQLIRGHGLVWNEGERVEGYTNLIWTVTMAVPLRLGIDPVGFSYAAGIAAFVLSLFLTYGLGRALLGSGTRALLAVLLLGTNHTFSAYATGGLETQWQACLFTACALILVRLIAPNGVTTQRLGLLSGLLGIAVLTRIDSAVLVLWACTVVGLVLRREQAARKAGLGRTAAALGPFVLVTGTWFLWKLSYYGAVLPNTFYAKEPTLLHAARGLYYVGAFLVVYGLLPFAVALPFLLKRMWRSPGPKFELVAVAALVCAWSVYVISVGGDFMEFRFMVPVLPCLFILVTWTIMEWTRARLVRTALVLLVVCGSIFESRLSSIRGLQTIAGLSQPVAEWRQAGEVLGRSFGDGRGVTIATTAAGTIPFYSRLKTIDMAGLNDAWVARNGTWVRSGVGLGPKIGHQRVATLQYLLERRVNLVLGHPWIREDSDVAAYSLNGLREWSAALTPQGVNQEDVLLGAKIVEIPIHAERKLVALYLVRNPVVDSAIEAHGWELHPISKD